MHNLKKQRCIIVFKAIGILSLILWSYNFANAWFLGPHYYNGDTFHFDIQGADLTACTNAGGDRFGLTYTNAISVTITLKDVLLTNISTTPYSFDYTYSQIKDNAQEIDFSCETGANNITTYLDYNLLSNSFNNPNQPYIQIGGDPPLSGGSSTLALSNQANNPDQNIFNGLAIFMVGFIFVVWNFKKR